MFTVTDDLQDILQARTRDLLFVFEIYSYDYVPFPETSDFSYDPRHAVALFAGQSVSFTWGVDTITYRREVLDGPTVNKHIGKQFDTVSIRFSNVSRYMASFILNNKIQGMRLVVRVIPKSANSLAFVESSHSPFAHSIILFVGRVNKPDGFDRSSGTISATQDLGTIQAQIPPQQFQPSCPLVNVFKKPGFDCMGNEAMSAKSATYQAAKRCNGSFAQCTEYENTEFFGGTRIVQLTSSFVYRPHRGLFTRIINIVAPISIPIYNLLRRRTVVGNSIHDGTPYGSPIPVILGRWKKKLTALQFQDTGETIWFKMAACRGLIKDFLAIFNEAPNFSQPLEVVEHLGDYGDTGTQTADTVFPDASFHSKLAYITGRCIGSNVEVEDPAPDISSVVAGALVPFAYGTHAAGVGRIDNATASYDHGSEWTDNPVDHAYYMITEPMILGIDPVHMAQKSSARAAAYCTGAIKDVSNAERCLLPDTETANAGVLYKRYYSTGVIGPKAFHGTGLEFLTPAQRPGGNANREAEYEFFDPDSPPTSLDLVTFYRKRYTSNIEINEQKKAIDFLYDTLLTSFRGFLRFDNFGRIAIDCERPADHSFLRADAIPGATSIKVLDVTPWAPLDAPPGEPDPLRGKVLIGTGRLNSEVRTVSSALYSADGDAITLSASATGGLSAVANGATLSGGSTSTPSSETVTISGTPVAGDTITIIIDGYEVVWTATDDDVSASIPNLTLAEQMVFAINAEPGLKEYVEAHRGAAPGASTDVEIISKYGVLNFTPALAESHYAEISNPTTAPTLGSSAGALEAGTYQVAYAYRNANGNTQISNIASITIIANKQIDVTGISPPAGTTVDWFVSVEADSGVMLLVLNNNGAGFSINELPAVTEADVPKRNTTGEETLRVMMSFAGKSLTYADTSRANVLDGSFAWPEGGRQSTVNQVKTQYREAIRDFGNQPLIVNDSIHQEQTGQINSVDLDLSCVDNFNQASRLCNGYLAKFRDTDFFFSWASAGEALLLEVGDVVCASDDSGEWRNVPIRIEDPSYNQRFEVAFAGRLYATSVFDDEVLQTDVPLPSALTNYLAGPPDIAFNTTDFPPNGLVQSTTATAGITSIRGGAVFGASSYPQHAIVRLIKRGGVTVNEQVGILLPDSNLEAVFEFIASTDGLYTVELEVCDSHNICNTTKPTADIVIGFGSLFGLARENGFLILREQGDILEREH